MHYVDPVALRAAELLASGRRCVVPEARMSYGQAADVLQLVATLEKLPDDGRVRVIDLSTAQSLGDAARLAPLQSYARTRPVLVVLDAGVEARVRSELLRSEFGIAIVDYERARERSDAKGAGACTFVDAEPGTHPGVAAYLRETGRCARGSDASAAYREWREAWLTGLVETALQPPPEGHRWLGLGDGTVANYWINIKRLLATPETSTAIAYHVAREITGDFRELPAGGGPAQRRTIVVGSNTAAVIASLLRGLLGGEIEVAVFDRMGPFAHLSRARLSVLRPTPPRIVILEDVVSTGRELDMIALLALTKGSEVELAVCLFDLEVGKSRLVAQDCYRAMARPRISLGYSRTLEGEVKGPIWRL